MPAGFFAILDDITALMDDVAAATKIATRKTAAILGDDLAVNAQKATGFLANRELPVLWSITKGSLLNKLIIVPVALLLNAFVPAAITVILLLGGVYLAYEGMEKILEHFFHRKKIEKEAKAGDEKTKIKSAIATDFILSIEIVIIALGTVATENLNIQILTVSTVALLATVGVYGIVALLVRTDDAGYRLLQRSGNKGLYAMLGRLLVRALPVIIAILSVAGTLALVMVAGGIFVHHLGYLHDRMARLPATMAELIAGLVVGLAAVAAMTVLKKLISYLKKTAPERRP